MCMGSRSKHWTVSCNYLRTTLPLLVASALTGFFNVLVHIITAGWGVWDVVMGHKVNLEEVITTYNNTLHSDLQIAQKTAGRVLQKISSWHTFRLFYKLFVVGFSLQDSKVFLIMVSVFKSVFIHSRDVLRGTLALTSREHFAPLHPHSDNVWQHHSAHPRSSLWSPCTCGSGHHCTLWMVRNIYRKLSLNEPKP